MIAVLFVRSHCEERSDEAISLSTPYGPLIKGDKET